MLTAEKLQTFRNEQRCFCGALSIGGGHIVIYRLLKESMRNCYNVVNVCGAESCSIYKEQRFRKAMTGIVSLLF